MQGGGQKTTTKFSHNYPVVSTVECRISRVMNLKKKNFLEGINSEKAFPPSCMVKIWNSPFFELKFQLVR